MIIVPVPHHIESLPDDANGVVVAIYTILVFIYLGLSLFALGYMVYTLLDMNKNPLELDDDDDGFFSFKKRTYSEDDSFFDRHPIACVVVGLTVFGLVVLTVTGYWWE